MASVEELLAKRRRASARTVKVDAVLEVADAEEVAALEAELAEVERSKDDRLGALDPAEGIRARLEELRGTVTVLTFEFERLPGLLWAELKQRTMPRDGYPVDAAAGYNIQDAAVAAIKMVRGDHHYGWRVTDDGPETLTDDQWDELLDSLGGVEAYQIVDEVWTLNEVEPTLRLVEAKKALAAGEGSSS